MDKEENIMLRHLLDLEKAANTKDITIFSDFLNVREVYILKRNLPRGRFFLFGGADEAERVMACFPASYEDLESILFPISCISIKVKGAKFEKTSLSHRDFLGAVLGIGIDRKLIGDIYVESEKGNTEGAFVFCQSKIADFIISELRLVGRAPVECIPVPLAEAVMHRKINEKKYTVPSLRLDVVAGEAFNLSRSKIKSLIDGKKVSLNAAEADSSHYQLVQGDIVSVKGFGKFIFNGSLGYTKKERIQISIGLYK